MPNNKLRPWDEWIKGATEAFKAASPAGAAAAKLGSMAIEKIKRDARNEFKAASFPERKTIYSRTPQEKEKNIERIMRSPSFGNVSLKSKSGSVGRESAEMARERKRRGY